MEYLGTILQPQDLVNKEFVENLADEVEAKIPTKVSQLQNDQNYVEDADANNKVYARKNKAWQEFEVPEVTIPVTDVQVNDVSVVDNSIAKVIVPTKVGDLENDQNYTTLAEVAEVGYALDSDLQDVSTRVTTIDGKIPSVATTSNQLADKKFVTDITTPIQTAVTIIEGKIPSAATSSNQLADKEFVNSSIATSTATFRGTFESTDDFPTTGIDDNDYLFYKHTDSAGNTLFDRYKYASNQWTYEYTLNNSSFTADQWAAVNSNTL